ncbi:lasso peptide biosynthesis B2 protein [Phenylobacterium sp.]|uniref:lasso peptide biosynthesis B2 protein n=1 Tax=Phenylobacterium sp. TaxID=1871053 RepID=UPI003BABF77A
MSECSSQTWSLGAGVHAVVIDRDVVFLNIGADRYDCLPDAAAELDLDRSSRRVTAAPDMAEALFSVGLLARDGDLAPVKPIPAMPCRSDLPRIARRLRWRDLEDLLRSTLDIAVAYRGRSLAQIIAAARRSRPANGDGSADPADIVARYHAWVPYAPVSGKCLLRSFMLLRALHRAGHTADWVFGVATWPFRAHCWLQMGDIVLDDTVERVRAYEPILVV